MMWAWIAYMFLLTAALAVTALGLEQLSRRSGWATRWVWAGAIMASLVIPATLLITPREAGPQAVIEGHASIALPSEVSAAQVMNEARSSASPTSTKALDSALIYAWATLSALMIAVIALSWLRLTRAAANCTTTRVAGVTVLISDDLGPAVIGFFPGRIVLPRWMLKAEASVQRMTVLHESQHLFARDPQLLLAALGCVALMPWNLPLWWMLQRLRAAVEIDCDARVLSSGEDLAVYGRALLDVADSHVRTPLLAPALIERTTQLERRIRLLDMHARSASKPLLLTAALALISVTGVAMAQVAVPQPLRLAAAMFSSKPGGPELLDALIERNSDRAIELIDAGADINYRRLGDGTPLIIAARRGLVPVVERLLAQGADANQESRGDGNPLIVAAASGNERIATLLVAAGANVNGFVEDDETPLINAARRGHLGMVQYLLDQGADVNFSVVANKFSAPERRSALSQAEKHGHRKVADYLRARGAKS